FHDQRLQFAERDEVSLSQNKNRGCLILSETRQRFGGIQRQLTALRLRRGGTGSESQRFNHWLDILVGMGGPWAAGDAGQLTERQRQRKPECSGTTQDFRVANRVPLAIR